MSQNADSVRRWTPEQPVCHYPRCDCGIPCSAFWVRDDCIVCGVRTPDHAVGCAAFACRGADAIKAERWRQIQTEGWTPEHDAEHDSGELVLAARCYAEAATAPMPGKPPTNWPWHPSWWKPSADPIRNLEKAGALIAAEIDRRLRAAPNAGSDDA